MYDDEDPSMGDVVSNGDPNLKSSEEDNCSFIKLARAVYEYHAKSDVELDFSCGDTIAIHSKTNESWWWGEVNGRFGYVPVNHISSYLKSDKEGGDNWQNDSYFEIYGQLKIQHEMLSDQPRTQAYLEAIKSNCKFITGTKVMDVGCGTGILSLFLARDGKVGKVYAVEASSVNRIAEHVVKVNGYEGQIEVVGKMVEEVALTEKMDLIVSEWMGTLLISEFMIESVIKARDMFLKPEGKIWPSKALLYLAPCSAVETYKSTRTFWNDLFGFDFSIVKAISPIAQTGKPLHDHITKREDILAKPTSILDLEMKTITVEGIENITHNFHFSVNKSGVFNGFCTWFTVIFDSLSNLDESSVVLDTGPNASLTHWKHPLLFMDVMIDVFTHDEISGTVELKRNVKMRRHLSLKICCKIIRDSKVISNLEKTFKCWE